MPSGTTFAFDALWRRRTRAADGASRSYLYDGDNAIQEQGGSGAPSSVIAGSTDEWFYRVADGIGLVPLVDALGSTVATSDVSGAITSSVTYQPFGSGVSSGPQSFPNLFTGREPEAGGLYFHRARFFDTVTSRFISEDPLEMSGGNVNVYSYASNRPTVESDPSGLYGYETHYTLTKGIAVQVGCSQQTAERIAFGNQGVDDNPVTSPWSGEQDARSAYHFTKPGGEAWRKHLWKDGFSSNDPADFGKYLHAMQDSFSHQRGKKNEYGKPYGPVFGHFWTKWPDNPRNRPELWKRMMERTTAELYIYCNFR